MILTEVKSRLATAVRDMALPKRSSARTTLGGTITTGNKRLQTTNRSSDSPTFTSALFNLESWARMKVRTRFRIMDVVLNCILLTPLAVLFQVAACGIQDFFFLNYVPGFVGTIMLLSIGFSIEFGCSFWQKYLSSLSYVKDKPSDDVAFVVSTRLYHFAVGFANVCHYRGLSDIYYFLLGNGCYAAMQAITTTSAVLLALKCARNVLGSPLCVGVDNCIDDFFETSTLYRTKDDDRMKHMIDNAATVVVVASLCFLNWISLWAFFDCTIFPEHSALSVITSWIIGYSIITLAFLLEPTAMKISRDFEVKENGTAKTLFEDFFLLVCNCGVILIWRGHWVFFEGLMYYFPIYHNGVDISAFYGIFSSFVMMCLLNASNTLIMKGCDYDGEQTEGNGVSFSVDYFAVHFKKEIEEEEKIEAEEKKKSEQEAAKRRLDKLK